MEPDGSTFARARELRYLQADFRQHRRREEIVRHVVAEHVDESSRQPSGVFAGLAYQGLDGVLPEGAAAVREHRSQGLHAFAIGARVIEGEFLEDG
jgi:hypothetical protein